MTDGAMGRRALGVGAFVLFFVLFLAGLAPFTFEFPLQDIEGSWILASVYAGLHHFAYGTQLVFTNGPLFPLYHREYAFGMSAWYALGRLLLAIYFAYGFACLGTTRRASGWAVVIVAFALLWPTIVYQAYDGILLVIPLLAALLVLADRGGWPTLLVGVVLSAAVAIAKVSFIPFCIGAFLLVDVALLSRRHPPLAFLTYVLASWGLFMLGGQSWSAFIPFLVGSGQMAAGYTAALALDGPAIELEAWLAIWAFVVIVLATCEIRAVQAGAERPVIAVLRILLALGFCAISLKAGFVRHDGHSVAAWGMLAFFVILLGLPGTLPAWRPRVTVIYYAVPVLAVVVAYGFFLIVGRYVDALTMGTARIFAEQMREGALLATNPGGWADEQNRLWQVNAAKIRAAQPLPQITGSVDAIANTQASIIAAGLDYQPRPTIQENMTVTPTLIARNRDFLEGPDAPGTLLFAPGATDRRHPASVEGSLWPLLLSNFQVDGRAAGQLLLGKRATPLAVGLSEATVQQTGFDRDISLPAGHIPLFLKLDIAETPLGRLADLVFKPPLVHLVVRYADGSSETYRLIPGMIHDGMVVSPTIRTIDDYDRLAHGADLSGLSFPVAVQVTSDGDWAYSPTITASMQALSVPAN